VTSRSPLPARVLIPVANPATAEELVRIGADLADRRAGELTALGIVEVPEGMPLSEGATRARQARRLLQRVLDFAPEGTAIHPIVRIGRHAAEGILEAATEQEADLIIFGWGGRVAGGRDGSGPTIFSTTIVIPCRNERGNIEAAVQRIPPFGGHQEIIFVDGHSTDGTIEEIQHVMAAYPDKDIRLLVQDGTGKGDAVRKGFAQATGDILMILDADLTMPPEDLPKFYDAIASGKGEFINGCRLVYPMESQAMRTLNLLGNKFFSMAFSWLLNQRIKDTLCGTKVLFRRDYERLVTNRHYFGDFDPFGDFDLLFGASKLNLHILEIPIRYQDRTYGSTNIQRFAHGWLLLKMTVYGFFRLKAV